MDRSLMDDSLAQTKRRVSSRSTGWAFRIQLRWKQIRKRVSRVWRVLGNLVPLLAKDCLDLLPNGLIKWYGDFWRTQKEDAGAWLQSGMTGGRG